MNRINHIRSQLRRAEADLRSALYEEDLEYRGTIYVATVDQFDGLFMYICYADDPKLAKSKAQAYVNELLDETREYQREFGFEESLPEYNIEVKRFATVNDVFRWTGSDNESFIFTLDQDLVDDGYHEEWL